MDTISNRSWWIGGAIVALVIVGLFYYFSKPAHAGTVYITVSDASADLENVSDVMMTVDKVELRSATGAWVTVSDTPRTYKLLSLKESGKAEFSGKADIAEGNYDQVRTTVSKVEVQMKDGTKKQAALATKTYTMTGKTIVREGQTTHADIDIHTSDSMHTATDGSYVFTPVVQFTSRSNTKVAVDSENYVTATGGTQDTNVMAGSDLSGQMHINAALSPNVRIQLNGSALIMGSSSASSTGSTSSTVNTSGLIQIDSNGVLNVNMPFNVSGSASSSSNTNTGTNASSSTQGSGSVNVGGTVNVGN
ncbi:DUF4382 domain-containing protein [Patescibacteria group bacterium]|nr:DUF4382 domain-containing protein [Patescibacteria group bacterium]